MPSDTASLVWIGLSVFLMGMNKGGLPVGSIALPVLILFWPDEAEQAKRAVAFMLPLLCVMDVVAIAFYRRHVLWKRLWPMMPGTLAGVALASVLFVSKESALVSVPDRWVKLLIGVLGVLFVLHQAARKWVTRTMGEAFEPGWRAGTGFGLAAGVVSTITHSAGSIVKMYLLPQQLGKMNFAATNAGYFFVINLVKLLPFWLLGRFEGGNLALAAWMLPVIPFGVAAGYAIVRLLEEKYYIGFIYFVLFCTSAALIYKAIAG